MLHQKTFILGTWRIFPEVTMGNGLDMRQSRTSWQKHHPQKNTQKQQRTKARNKTQNNTTKPNKKSHQGKTNKTLYCHDKLQASHCKQTNKSNQIVPSIKKTALTWVVNQYGYFINLPHVTFGARWNPASGTQGGWANGIPSKCGGGKSR